MCVYGQADDVNRLIGVKSCDMNILLVDDERGFVEALAERLALRGFVASVAYDAASAISMVNGQSFDAMVLDLRLPDASGLKVLRHVRQNCPQTPVHVLTGHGAGRDRDVCLKVGAVSFLNKPVSVDQLAAILRNEEDGK